MPGDSQSVLCQFTFRISRTSLVVSGKDFAFQCRGYGFDPWSGTKIPHALRTKRQNIKQRQYCNKFSECFKNGPYNTHTHTHTQISEREITTPIFYLKKLKLRSVNNSKLSNSKMTFPLKFLSSDLKSSNI